MGGELDIVKSMLEVCPTLNISQSLQLACYHGHMETMKFLLSLPGIHLTGEGWNSETALASLCKNGHYEALDFFLCHPRTTSEIFIEEISEEPNSPNHRKIFLHLRASRFPLHISHFPGEGSLDPFNDDIPHDPFNIFNDTEEIELVDFKTCDPDLRDAIIREKLLARRELQKDGEIFALSVLLFDGYLQLKEINTETELEEERNTHRFFKILERLPMELQMLLCKKVYLQTDDIYLPSEVEHHLKKVVFKFF